MDTIAFWEPPSATNDVEPYIDLLYDAMWFLKRTAETGLGFWTQSVWPPVNNVQGAIQVEFRLSAMGALTVALPGNWLREQDGSALMTRAMKAKLREFGWLPPRATGSGHWTLPPPVPVEGFVRRSASIIAHTLAEAFDEQLNNTALAFGRATQRGAVPYQAPLPDLIELERDMLVDGNLWPTLTRWSLTT